jgi:hypothetical protein
MTRSRGCTRWYRFGFAIALVAGPLLAGGCGDDESTDPPPPGSMEPFFPADFEDVYVMVRDCRTSTTHPNSIAVWVDPVGAQDYLDERNPLPVGTVVVKVVHVDDDCGNVRQFDVMKKGPEGTAPTANDWIWQEVSPDRTVLSERTDNPSCISCHLGCSGRDYQCTEP